MQLRGRVALVTGASAGVGREVALRLARADARVLAAGRDPDRTDEVARLTGGTPLLADLAEAGAPAELARRALAVHGHVDLLVANAGLGWAGPFVQMSPDSLDELVRVDLRAPMQLTRALLPQMLARGVGHVALVGSVAGATGVAGETVYAATKAGLEVFAESLAQELHGSGVGVSLLVPGVVATRFFDNRGGPQGAYRRRVPVPVPPGRVAEALLEAVAHDRVQAWVPRWLRVAQMVRAVAPGTYRRLSTRFGERVRSRAPEEVGEP